jgi:hypothetical protein
MSLINWELIKNPYNWVIVVIMTAFALILLSVIMPEESPAG